MSGRLRKGCSSSGSNLSHYGIDNTAFVHRVLLGSTQDDHHSLLSDLRAASVAKTPLSKILDARKMTEVYRLVFVLVRPFTYSCLWPLTTGVFEMHATSHAFCKDAYLFKFCV